MASRRFKNDRYFRMGIWLNMNEWMKKGKTYRAKSLAALKVLYGSGIPATLESQPKTDWEDKKTSKEASKDDQGKTIGS